MKKLRKRIAKLSNEVYRRTEDESNNKQEKKKKKLKQVRAAMHGTKPATLVLRMYNETWIVKHRYKRVKLQKVIEKSKRIMDNASFE